MAIAVETVNVSLLGLRNISIERNTICISKGKKLYADAGPKIRF